MTELNFSSIEESPTRVAARCLTMLRKSRASAEPCLRQLAEMATSSDTRVAKQATAAIFASLVEPLSDSFQTEDVSLYNWLFSYLIQACRRLKDCREVDQRLSDFGLRGQSDLLSRSEGLRLRSTVIGSDYADRIQRVIVLSRVTLGADVAITSVIVEALKQHFPTAEVVFLGGEKVEELFGGDKRLTFSKVDYLRDANLDDRLTTWVDLLGIVRSLIDGLETGEYLIVDPDSRLTQLGILPLTKSTGSRSLMGGMDADYLFFPSREYGASTSHSLAELTSSWMNDVFGSTSRTLPHVSLKPSDREMASAFVRKVRRRSPIVSVNFGVGENPGKRIGGEFERSVIGKLLQEGASVILDRGVGDEESARVDDVASCIRSFGSTVIEVREQNIRDSISTDAPQADLLVCRGRIGLVASLIAESDLYIGYDSAGQHIGAATGVPCIDVMAGFSSPRMIQRWRPTGPAETVVIDGERELRDQNAVSESVLQRARGILGRI